MCRLKLEIDREFLIIQLLSDQLLVVSLFEKSSYFVEVR